MDALDYDWCTLVLTNLLRSVRSFGRRFYSQGHAGGCGGCTLFALIFYLDRLDREAVDWGVFPRLKVWNFKQIILASKEDRSITGGDYGKIGTLDVAYGEIHPRQARDTDGPVKVELDENMDTLPTRARRGASRSKYPHQRVDNKSVAGNAVIDKFHTTLTRTKTAAYGYDAPYGHSFLEALNRGISKEAMFLFRRITSFVMSNCTSSAVFPLRCEVVSFGGGCSQLQKLVTPSLFSFVTNPGSRFLVVVSEVYVPGTPTSVTGTPVFFHICVALKATSPSSEMLLIHADSVAPTINVDKRSIMNSDQVHDNIFQYCLKGLAECKLSRNLVLLDTSRP